jgi:hypothetical protein
VIAIASGPFPTSIAGPVVVLATSIGTMLDYR